MIEPHSACGATGPGGGASEGRFSRTPPGLGEGIPRPKPRRSAGFTLPRPLPWATPLSRAWPGTLIACWTVLTRSLWDAYARKTAGLSAWISR